MHSKAVQMLLEYMRYFRFSRDLVCFRWVSLQLQVLRILKIAAANWWQLGSYWQSSEEPKRRLASDVEKPAAGRFSYSCHRW